jgi:hypothetical protein
MLEKLLKQLIKEVKEEKINQKLFEHVQATKKIIR